MLPAGFRLGDNDSRILAVARNLPAEGTHVTVVSKDLPMRVKASSVGLDAEEYRAELAVGLRLDRDGRTRGRAPSEMAALYAEHTLVLAEAADLPCTPGLVLHVPARHRRWAG